MATVYATKSMEARFAAEDGGTARAIIDRDYDKGGSAVGATKGASCDAILKAMDYEDMLREVSKLPPAQRKAALREMKRMARDNH